MRGRWAICGARYLTLDAAYRAGLTSALLLLHGVLSGLEELADQAAADSVGERPLGHASLLLLLLLLQTTLSFFDQSRQ
jgi:hypothetical protein